MCDGRCRTSLASVALPSWYPQTSPRTGSATITRPVTVAVEDAQHPVNFQAVAHSHMREGEAQR